MDIIRKEDDIRKYCDLNIGQVFIYADDVYMRTECGALQLDNGSVDQDFLGSGRSVRVVKAKLYIE